METLNEECTRRMSKKFSLSILHRMRILYISVRKGMSSPLSKSKKKSNHAPQMSTSSFDFIIENNESSTIYGKNGERITMKEINIGEERDELEGISDSLTGLTSMLSEMSEKVLAQGEMVDRIDVNTKYALDTVVESNKVLIESKEIMENGCATRLQKWLMMFNLLLSLIHI